MNVAEPLSADSGALAAHLPEPIITSSQADSDRELGIDAVAAALRRAEGHRAEGRRREGVRAVRGLLFGFVFAIPLWALLFGLAGAVAWLTTR